MSVNSHQRLLHPGSLFIWDTIHAVLVQTPIRVGCDRKIISQNLDLFSIRPCNHTYCQKLWVYVLWSSLRRILFCPSNLKETCWKGFENKHDLRKGRSHGQAFWNVFFVDGWSQIGRPYYVGYFHHCSRTFSDICLVCSISVWGPRPAFMHT